MLVDEFLRECSTVSTSLFAKISFVYFLFEVVWLHNFFLNKILPCTRLSIPRRGRNRHPSPRSRYFAACLIIRIRKSLPPIHFLNPFSGMLSHVHIKTDVNSATFLCQAPPTERATGMWGR
jgi:hypothetical protein